MKAFKFSCALFLSGGGVWMIRSGIPLPPLSPIAKPKPSGSDVQRWEKQKTDTDALRITCRPGPTTMGRPRTIFGFSFPPLSGCADSSFDKPPQCENGQNDPDPSTTDPFFSAHKTHPSGIPIYSQVRKCLARPNVGLVSNQITRSLSPCVLLCYGFMV